MKNVSYSFDTEILDGGFYELRYPANYSFLNEGGGETLGFFFGPPDTIGVLRLSTYTFQSTEAARQTFENGFLKMQDAVRIDVNGMACMFFIKELAFGSNDHLFWIDDGGSMSMYFYTIQLGKHLFCFSYRLPSKMEDNGKFDGEHPLVMESIGSLHLK